MRGVAALPQLACDRMMPMWVARAYGLPPGLGVVRWSWLTATARGKKRHQVWWVGWSLAEASLPPRVVRHGLLLSVARYLLGVEPGIWDALAVREVRQGATRRTEWGREWVKREWRSLRGVSRPDAEWWRSGGPPWPPTAVEVDTGKIPMDLYRARVETWRPVYPAFLVVTTSRSRAESWREMLSQMPDFRDLLVRPTAAVVALAGWWHEGATLVVVWSTRRGFPK
ncbi:hypothetical protein [Thermus sp.]|uniref:hypothetical protein n=1 Tax=Thermus sp. TaxID=275 RepID=UPI0025FC4BA0|nr:hypothetical protein [Thermus sp.]MCS6867795.1 hypothetical protein [Thermus sp.]